MGYIYRNDLSETILFRGLVCIKFRERDGESEEVY
jgi:hypothetical protein